MNTIAVFALAFPWALVLFGLLCARRKIVKVAESYYREEQPTLPEAGLDTFCGTCGGLGLEGGCPVCGVGQ